MPVNGFGESLIVVIDVVLGLCKLFTEGSLFFVQTVQCLAQVKIAKVLSRVTVTEN